MKKSSPDHNITQTMRNYLADIYRLSQEEAWVSTTTLAEALAVSPAAAVRMIKRLVSLGLLEHQPYQGVMLTPQGINQARQGIRRHRLLECCLVDMLGFGWHEVHDEAAAMQHGISQKIEDRIDEILGYPTRCPHGEPIPSRSGEMPVIDDLPLAGVPVGANGHISRIKTHDPGKLQYLANLKLVPGTPFTLVSRQPFNGPIRLTIDGRTEQVIGSELAATIWVTRNQV